MEFPDFEDFDDKTRAIELFIDRLVGSYQRRIYEVQDGIEEINIPALRDLYTRRLGYKDILSANMKQKNGRTNCPVVFCCFSFMLILPSAHPEY